MIGEIAPLIERIRCPICNDGVVIRLPDDWRAQVDAGSAIPIIGCGNPWHYADHTLGDASRLEGVAS